MLFSFLSFTISHIIFFILHVSGTGSFPKPLSAKQEKELLLRLKQGDPIARSKLIEHNLRLVAHIIKKYYSNLNDQDDLVSIGTIGLIKAINTFNPDKGIRLSSYAARCIENEILMSFRNNKKNSLDVSMNDPIDNDSDGNTLTLTDVLASEDSIIDDIDTKIKAEKLKHLINNVLSPREKIIIQLRYGLNNHKPLTQREVASMLNISRSYVSRIEKKTLFTLRKKFNSD